MAFGGNVPHFDTVYQRVCLQLSHARLAVGGDSHARNTVWKIEGILGTQQYRGGLSTLRGNRGLEHFAVGGGNLGKVYSFSSVQFFEEL